MQAGRAEVRGVIDRAAHRRSARGEPTVFFLDEIHRFNKAQQDALLPAVEEGLVTLIGATTENPYFEVNSALLSRTQVYELHELTAEEIESLLRRALERGECAAEVPDDALEFLAARAGGDARTALAALELACATAASAGEASVTLEGAQEALQRKAIRFDRAGDQHYDYISAWIKATRASDPDAALYYLAVMLEGGEDARFLVRRMVIFASEDIGNADPQALVVATAAAAAVEHVGMPEAVHALSQATIYLALAPKSKAATISIGKAIRHVREHGAAAPPPQIRSHPVDYDSPHNHPGHVSPQEVAPDEVVGERFYEPDEMEAELLRAAGGHPPPARARVSAGANRPTPPPCGSSRSARSTARRLGSVAATAPADVAAAVAVAAEVQQLWAQLRAADRARYLARAAQAVIDEWDELVRIIVAEQGRPVAEAQTMELLPAVETLLWLAEHGPRILGPERVGLSRSLQIAKRARLTFEPLGVVAVLTPGAEPFATPLGDVAIALMGGNGVVLHPSPLAALAGERIARAFARAGLPEGLLQVVHGDPETARALVSAPDIAHVRFTGSSQAGRDVGEACARELKRATIEVGGKDPMLVLADANIPRAVGGAVWGAFANAGQSGGSLARAYVLRERYDRFLAGVVVRARALRVGHPGEPTTEIGPLLARDRLERLVAFIDEAVAAGATLHCGGPVQRRRARRRVLRPRRADRRAGRRAAAARGRARPVDRGAGRRQRAGGHRAVQRRHRRRARRLGVDGRPVQGRAHRARDPRRDGLDERPRRLAHRAAAALGRRPRRRHRARARRRRAAGDGRAQARHVGPARRADPVVAALRQLARRRLARARAGCARRATPTASAAGATGRCRWPASRGARCERCGGDDRSASSRPARPRAAFAAMQALRPHLADEAEFARRVDELQRPQGYRLVAVVEDDGAVSAVAGFRVLEMLAYGRVLYIDDLSTLPAARRRGHARALLEWCAEEATRLGCAALQLDSNVGPERVDAHRLYFNSGMRISSYHFARRL